MTITTAAPAHTVEIVQFDTRNSTYLLTRSHLDHDVEVPDALLTCVRGTFAGDQPVMVQWWTAIDTLNQALHYGEGFHINTWREVDAATGMGREGNLSTSPVTAVTWMTPQH